MSEKPKQRFWQLHLSTLMLLMLIAAGLVGLNLRPYGGRIELGKGNSVEVTAANIEDGGLIGWPTAMGYDGSTLDSPTRTVRIWSQQALAVNVLVGVLILVSVATAIEFLLHRRERRQ